MWRIGCWVAISLVCWVGVAVAEHGRGVHVESELRETDQGVTIPGVPFQVFMSQGRAGSTLLDQAEADAAVRVVVETLTFLVSHRAEYPHVDESLKKEALKQILIEPRVFNAEGKEFPFLVARTKEPGKVTLLISEIGRAHV